MDDNSNRTCLVNDSRGWFFLFWVGEKKVGFIAHLAVNDVDSRC